ncbi:MAG: hypothetical protein GXY33_12210 [Phycisphaerae bacterium]|nr:hypothetical protein [Phycisphaerae bacterium]
MRTVLTRPAQEWIEGWPLGNGITAAMLWGPPGRTVLSLNHVDFWRDHAGRQIGDYSQIVRQARDLMMAGQAKEANDLYAQKIDMAVMPRDHETSDSYTGYTNSFQPIGDLVLELDGQDACRDYRRSLDLVSGTAAVRWRTEGRITQECFVPLNDDVIVVRLTAERQLSGRLQFTRRPQDHYRWSAKVEGASLCVQGAFDEGVGSGLEASLHCDGGTVRADHQANGLVFTDATDLVLLIAVEAGKGDRDWLAAAREKMQRARGVAVAEMRDRHIREHSTAFGRASLCLDRVNKNKEANLSELIGRAVDGTFEPRLAEAIFDMGRYLILAANRAGRRPANLQGIWNDQFTPEWDADWHFDMNVEMNHWLCNPAALPECNLALFNQMDRFVETGRSNAAKMAGCAGILFYGIAGGDSMVWSRQGPFWSGAAAWIAQHYWTHYEYTMDLDFLRERAYPFIREVGLFYRDFLVRIEDGSYVTGLSHSPENAPANGYAMTVHAAMDTALVREVMRHLLEGGQILGVDRDLWPLWRELHDRILPYAIGEGGELKEWPAPLAEQPAHRHFSHLYPLFPGDEFTFEQTPELMEAARKAVALREAQGRSHNFGWSYAYLAAMYARLGDAELACESLFCLARSVLLENLLTVGCDLHDNALTADWAFNVPRLFQIEAGLGAAFAVAEMLLQSHRGIIRLLPALPTAWPEGEVRGLRARGAFSVGIAWTNSRLTEARITSDKGQPCRVRCPAADNPLQVTHQGHTIPTTPRDDVVEFATEPGETYLITPQHAT